MLFIVPTPIGNLKDITLRALETLKAVDGVICEDSRRTGIFLNHYQIKKNLIVLNDFNESQKIPEILAILKSGQDLALVSDAGTPLISDPGYKLVRQCLQDHIPIDSLPGASSLIVALTLSGLPPDKFFFLGYLPEKSGPRITLLEKLIKVNNEIKTSFIAFVAPHKLVKTLADLQIVYGDIEITLAHELTKVHQFVKNQKISVWQENYKKGSPKGEFVLLFNLNY